MHSKNLEFFQFHLEGRRHVSLTVHIDPVTAWSIRNFIGYSNKRNFYKKTSSQLVQTVAKSAAQHSLYIKFTEFRTIFVGNFNLPKDLPHNFPKLFLLIFAYWPTFKTSVWHLIFDYYWGSKFDSITILHAAKSIIYALLL